MPRIDSKTQRLLRTIAGGFIGATVGLLCWLILFLLSSIDSEPHWKGTLIASGILLPIVCIAGGVIASQPFENRLNYIVANVGCVLLGTFLFAAAVKTLFLLEVWMLLILSVAVFFLLAFIERRYLSPIVNSCVEILSGCANRSG